MTYIIVLIFLSNPVGADGVFRIYPAQDVATCQAMLDAVKDKAHAAFCVSESDEVL